MMKCKLDSKIQPKWVHVLVDDIMKLFYFIPSLS